MAAEDPRSAKRRVESPADTHGGAAGHATYHSAVVRQAVAFDAMKEVFPDLSTAFLTHLPQDEAVHMFKNVSRKRAVAYLTKPALLGIMENSLVRMLPLGDKRLGIKSSSLTKAHSLSVDGGKSVRYDWPEHVMDWVGIPAFEAALKQGIAQDEEWRAFVVASDRAPKIAGVGPRRPATPTSAATKPKAAATASDTHTSTQKTDTGTQDTHRNGDSAHSTHDHGKQASMTPSKHDSTQAQAMAVQPAGGDEAKSNALTEEGHTHARHPPTHPDATQPGPPTHTHTNTHPHRPAHRPSSSSLAAAAAVTLAASTPSTITQDATTTHDDTHVSDASRDEAQSASSSTTASSSSMAGRPPPPTAGDEGDEEARSSSSSALSTALHTQSPTAKGPSAAATGTTSAQAESALPTGGGSESTRASTTDSAQSSVRDEKETLTADGNTGGGGGGGGGDEDEGRVGVWGKQAKRRAGGSGGKDGNEGVKVKGQGERQGEQGKGKAGETEESSAGNKRKRQMLSATEFLASTTTPPSSSAQPRKRTATLSPPRSTVASSNKSALTKRPPVGAKPSTTQPATKGASTSSSSTSRSSASGDAKSDKGAASTAARGRKRPPMPTRSQQVKEEGSKSPSKVRQKAQKEAETSGQARGGAEGGRGDGGRGGSNSRGKKRGHDDDVAPRTKDACNGRDDDHQGGEAMPVRGVGRKTANSLSAAANATLGGLDGMGGTGSGKSPRAKKPKTSSSSAATTNTTPPPAASSSSSSSSSSTAAGGKGGNGGGGGGEVAPMNVVDDVDDYMVSVRKELLGLTRGGNQELTHVALRAFHALVNGDKAMVVALQTAKSMEMPVSEVALNILVGLERAKATPPLDTLPYTHHVPAIPPTSYPPTSVSTPTPASPAV